MRRYGGADVQGLAETRAGAIRGGVRYAHVVARDEWDRVDSLPSLGNGNGREKAANE
jgi:hypothetical protein